MYRTLFVCTLLLFVISGPCSAIDAGNDDQARREELVKNLQILDPKVSMQAFDRIAVEGDPEFLPLLRPVLEQKDQATRRMVVLLVTRGFQQYAYDFFQEVLSSGNEHAREAAVHGLGMILDVRVPDQLVPFLLDPVRKMRVASLRGFFSQVMPAVRGAMSQVVGQQISIPPQASSCRQAALGAISTARVTQPDDPDIVNMYLRIADSSMGKTIRERWATAHPSAKLFEKIFKANDRWIGRPAVAGSYDYQLSMVNLNADSSKEIEIHATPLQVELLRAMGYDLDRVMHLRTAADLLFTIPDQVKAVVRTPKKSSDASVKSPVEIELQISSFPFRHAGIGLLNIAYWEGRVDSASKAILRFEQDSGRLVSESIRDAAGKELWKLEVIDWIDDQPFPRVINLDFPVAQIGGRKAHLKIQLDFQQRNDCWLLKTAQTFEILADGTSEIRAYGEVSWLASAEPVEDSSAAEEGEGSSSGQGSEAENPRE